ncbi:thioredoxin [Caedimonas varicaedens]|uniref:Thioredoxin n=1 Tax=Caedimonas varicaedens TaxID=1629334 RepID=A0A0K8MBE8_9PROT|nr:thioredoxin [Caedimonas varicaedens]
MMKDEDMQIFGHALQETPASPKPVTLESFQKEVMEASLSRPVLVDFWASWCAPCRQLAPLLEKAVNEEQETFSLVTINVDEEPEIAQQLRIQSLPTVLAFVKGQPVDGFTGLLSFQELKAFLAKLKDMIPHSSEALLGKGEEKLEKNESTEALQIFTEVLMKEPQNLRGLAGMVRGYLQQGDLVKAKGYYTLIPSSEQEHELVKALKKSIELAEQGQQAGDLSEICQSLEQDPLNHDKRLVLAKALFAQGQSQQAVEELLTILTYDFQWKDQQARTELLNFMEALGPSHSVVINARKRLSTLVFI